MPSGYPNEDAAHLALGTARRWLEGHTKKVSSSGMMDELHMQVYSGLFSGGPDHLLCVPEDGPRHLQ